MENGFSTSHQSGQGWGEVADWGRGWRWKPGPPILLPTRLTAATSSQCTWLPVVITGDALAFCGPGELGRCLGGQQHWGSRCFATNSWCCRWPLPPVSYYRLLGPTSMSCNIELCVSYGNGHFPFNQRVGWWGWWWWGDGWGCCGVVWMAGHGTKLQQLAVCGGGVMGCVGGGDVGWCGESGYW